MPITQDITVWRGNTAPPITWAWPAGYVGSPDVELSVWVADEMLFFIDLDGGLVSDAVNRQYLWYPTLALSRLIPTGRIADYELEDRSGGEVTLYAGGVTGLGGHNRDRGDTSYGAMLDFSDPAQTIFIPALW